MDASGRRVLHVGRPAARHVRFGCRQRGAGRGRFGVPGRAVLSERRRRLEWAPPELLERHARTNPRRHPPTQTRGSCRHRAMKALLLTNEYPPYVYGGAGVHVEFLSRELAQLMDVEVRSFGDQVVDDGRLKVRGYGLDDTDFTAPKTLRPVFGAFSRNIAMAATDVDARVV